MLVLRLSVEWPIVGGGQVCSNLGQAQLPPGRICVPLRGIGPPVGDGVEGRGVSGGQTAASPRRLTSHSARRVSCAERPLTGSRPSASKNGSTASRFLWPARVIRGLAGGGGRDGLVLGPNRRFLLGGDSQVIPHQRLGHPGTRAPASMRGALMPCGTSGPTRGSALCAWSASLDGSRPQGNACNDPVSSAIRNRIHNHPQ